MTPFQLDESAKAPCTSTIVGFSVFAWLVSATRQPARVGSAAAAARTLSADAMKGFMVCVLKRINAQARSERKPARMSRASNCGCSHAAKCPPRS